MAKAGPQEGDTHVSVRVVGTYDYAKATKVWMSDCHDKKLVIQHSLLSQNQQSNDLKLKVFSTYTES